MNMLSQVLSQVMNRAAAGRQKTKKKTIDPYEKIQIDQLIKASKETDDPREQEIIFKQLDTLGVNSDWRRELSGIETEAEKTQKQNKILYNQILSTLIPGLAGTITAPKPTPQPAQADIEQTAAPVTTPQISQPAGIPDTTLTPTPAPTQPAPTSLTGFPTIFTSQLAERATVNLHADGKFSISLGPMKKKTAEEIAEQELLTGPERNKFIAWQKKKLLGGETEVHFIQDQINGLTEMILLNDRGEVVDTFKYKTDLSAEQKRQQALTDELTKKFTTVDTGISELTGKPYKTVTTPRGDIATIEGTSQLKETPEEKRAAEAAISREQKLTENIVKTDASGNLVLIPVIAGKMGEKQTGPQVAEPKDKPKPPTAEVAGRMTALKNVADSSTEINDIINTQLAAEGLTLDDMTGPVKGRYRQFMSKWFDDPEFEKFKTSLSKLIPVVYGLTGKQLNQWELTWLQTEILPEITQPTANFLERFKDFNDWVKTRRVNEAVTALESNQIAVASSDLAKEVQEALNQAKPLTRENLPPVETTQPTQPKNPMQDDFEALLNSIKSEE